MKKQSNRVRISNGRVNVYGSRVLTSGIDFSQFERNPILLWLHRRGEVSSVVGTVTNLAIEGDDLVGELVFDRIGETSQLVADKWEKGTLRMVSANFEIIELSDSPEHILPGQRRHTVTRSELIEVSVVDIGGNKDALSLSYEGKSIRLDNSGDNQLPLLGDKNNHNKQNDMDLRTISLKLGLPETAGEQEVLDAIALLLSAKSEKDTLQAERDALLLSGITSLVDGAVTARKIGADKKAHFVELGQKVGIDSLKLTLDSMSAQVKPTDITGTGAGAQAGTVALEYKKLSDVPADELLTLRSEDRETYIKLYKAEYGVECEID